MKMRKLISLVLALAMLMGIAVPAMAATPSAQEVAGNRLLSLSVIDGYTDGTLGLDRNITRAEVAVVLAKISGMGDAADLLKDTPSKFSDVKTGEWYTGWINLASSQGWVVGDPQGTFRPNDNVQYREIVTMLLKALGYDDNLLGDWPTNFLAKAASLGITKDIVSDSKAAAVRGDVFIMTSRTLDETVVSWDRDTARFIEKEDKDGNKISLLEDKMNFDKVNGVVNSIARVSSLRDNQIRINNTTYKVVGNVDYEAVFGTEVNAWLNDDGDVVFIDIESDEVLYDALEDVSKDELTLVDADEDYDLADRVDVFINGVSKKVSDLTATYDYAKVVLDEDGDVAFIDAWNWDDFLVVEKVDGNDILGYGAELDAEDYVIVKDGKTISLADLDKGDILFYDDAEEYAEVFNNSVVDVIDEVYSNGFELDNGDDFNFTIGAGYDTNNVQYLNADSKMKNLGSDEAENMMDEGKNVEVFMDRNGNAVYVVGDEGEGVTSSRVGLLVRNSVQNTSRTGKNSYTLDIVNENGERVDYDVDGDVDFIATGFPVDEDMDHLWDTDFPAIGGASGTNQGLMAGKDGSAVILELTIDEDGDVTEVELLDKSAYISATNHFDATGNYMRSGSSGGGERLRSNTVVFATSEWNGSGWNKDNNYVDVFTLGDDKIEEMNDLVYVVDGNNVTYIVADHTDLESDNEDYVVAVRSVRNVSGSNEQRVTFLLDGVEKTLYTIDSSSLNVPAHTVGTITINEAKDEIVNFVANGTEQGNARVITRISLSDNEISFGANGTAPTYELLDDGYVYEMDGSSIKKDALRLRDLKVGDTVRVFSDVSGSGSLAKVILRTAKVDGSGGSGSVSFTGTIAFAQLPDTGASTFRIDIDGTVKSFNLTDDYIFVDSKGVQINSPLAVGTKVTFTTVEGDDNLVDIVKAVEIDLAADDNASIAAARALVVDTTLDDADTNLVTVLDAVSGMNATGVTLGVKAGVSGGDGAAIAANGSVTQGTTEQTVNVIITIAKGIGTTAEKTIAVTIPAE